MRITHLSDTHGIHEQLNFDGGDILIHTGDIFDFNFHYSEEQILDWFDRLPYAYKIIIKGNHDFFTGKNMPHNTYILENDCIDINGCRIYGISAVLHEIKSNKNYNTCNEKELRNSLINYPKIDFLCTHGSPKGILDLKFDKSIGSNSLLDYVEINKPKYHLFGHTHHSIGVKKNFYTTFVNNAIVGYIKDMNIQSKPINIDL